jgi:hypothetical protein
LPVYHAQLHLEVATFPPRSDYLDYRNNLRRGGMLTFWKPTVSIDFMRISNNASGFSGNNIQFITKSFFPKHV